MVLNAKPKKIDDPVDEEFVNSPSDLDDKTHAEMRMLYEESTKTMRFVKDLQWKTVGATLLTYFALIYIAGFLHADNSLANKLMAIALLLATSVIFTLIIYQFWMHNEIAKIDRMGAHMSSLFKTVRAIKSAREGNLHRYTLLVFMAVSVALGALVVHLALRHIATG
ncbi:MAG: hypothetical protein HQ483_08800 [Rhodospirillales bacterium]|nr:hypothetical protein [Rhodospirillales bacterium]